jgi:hypothetical protein
MTSARNILQSITVEPVFDIDELVTVIQALADLDRDSTACAMAMTAGGHGAGTGSAVRAALDAADIAAAAGRVLARGESADLAVVMSVVEAAAVAAERSAQECGAHAEHSEHCRIHSESAARAAGLLRAQLAGLS